MEWWLACSINGGNNKLECDVYLPEDETQLSLKPGEEIKGPELNIFCSVKSDPVLARKNWITARSLLAKKLYPVPEIGFPFISIIGMR